MTVFERAYAQLPAELVEEATGIVEAGDWYNEERTNPDLTRRITPAQQQELRALARRAA